MLSRMFFSPTPSFAAICRYVIMKELEAECRHIIDGQNKAVA